MSDANLGIKGKNAAPAIIKIDPMTAVDQTAVNAQHGSHVAPPVDPASSALFAANQKLGPANAALGDAVMADGNQEFTHLDQNGNQTA